MRNTILILFLLAVAPVQGQTALDTILLPAQSFLANQIEVTVRIRTTNWAAGQDTFSLWNFDQAMGNVSYQELKYMQDTAYKEIQLNPAVNVLSDVAMDNEALFYFKCSRDPSNYDISLLFFRVDYVEKPVDQLTLFYLKNGYWEEVSALSPQSDSVTIYQTGFYAVFDKLSVPDASIYAITSYPNPFDPFEDEGCHISYGLKTDSDVTIRVFTKYGDLVFAETCKKGEEGGRGSSAGPYLNRIFWDGRNKKGRVVNNGAYICQIVVDGQETRFWAIGVRR